MPIGLLLLLGLGIAGGAYALTHQGGEDTASKKTPPKPKPRTLTEQLPGGGRNPKVDAVKAKIETLKAKAAQGDRDAGRALEDLKRLYGNLTR